MGFWSTPLESETMWSEDPGSQWGCQQRQTHDRPCLTCYGPSSVKAMSFHAVRMPITRPSGLGVTSRSSKGKKARTAKENIVYNKKAVHGLLHRPAEETRQALNHPSVTYEDDNGNRKKGTELTVEDCSFGNCSVCKQTRPVAPTKRSGTTKHTYMCVDCLDKDTRLVYAARRD